MSIPEHILDGIGRLEPLPMTVQKLLVALHDENVNFNEISEAIEFDGAITANILRTANSAAFGGRVRIEHTRDAVVRLGTITLLDILLIGHLRSLQTAAPRYDFSEDDLWLHGATASLAVKALLKETRNRKIPEASTIAALIHDIGKLIMVRYMQAGASAAAQKCRENDVTFVEAERQLFGCDHAEVGGAMARKWSFPEPITAAIERHHNGTSSDPDLMLDAVMISNLIAKSVASASEGAPIVIDPASLAGTQERIGLTPEGLERICAQTALWRADLKQSYGMRS